MTERKEVFTFPIIRGGSASEYENLIRAEKGGERLAPALVERIAAVLQNEDGLRSRYELDFAPVETVLCTGEHRVTDFFIRYKGDVSVRIACTNGLGEPYATEVKTRIQRTGFSLTWKLHAEVTPLPQGASGTFLLAARATLHRPISHNERPKVVSAMNRSVQAFLKHWGGLVDQVERGFIIVRASGKERIYHPVRY